MVQLFLFVSFDCVFAITVQTENYRISAVNVDRASWGGKLLIYNDIPEALGQTYKEQGNLNLSIV